MEMCSDEEEAQDSGLSSKKELMCSSSSVESGAESGKESRGFSTEVSESWLWQWSSLSSSRSSGFSTDVSETGKQRRLVCVFNLEGRDCTHPAYKRQQ